MRVYISGPMTGIDDYNYPAFHAAKKQVSDLGHDPVSPADNFNGDTSKSYADYMRLDILLILTVDAVVVLPGWEESRGAKIETDIARCLDLPIMPLDDLQPTEQVGHG